MSDEDTGRTRGRPTKLTPEMQDRICSFIEAGMSQESAAAHAGVSEFTVINWKRRGKDEEETGGIYFQFLQALKEAERKQMGNDELVISNAASQGIWTAAAWRLERKYPHKYGRIDRVKADVASVASVQISTVDPENAAQALAELLETKRRIDDTPPDGS